jgi:glyoxylase-like metal-dependent hydrolase (beta-lactamase superfamily II)
MQKEENIPVFVNKKDDILVKNINELCHTFGLPANLPQVKITDYIDKNSKLEFAHKPIKIFETPGHTQGGLCFQIDNMLFSGDTLFYQGIGRSDLFGGDYNTLINSIKTELLPLPDDIEVFPGHGPKTTIALEKKFNPYLN